MSLLTCDITHVYIHTYTNVTADSSDVDTGLFWCDTYSQMRHVFINAILLFVMLIHRCDTKYNSVPLDSSGIAARHFCVILQICKCGMTFIYNVQDGSYICMYVYKCISGPVDSSGIATRVLLFDMMYS